MAANSFHDFSAARAGDWLTFSFESQGKVATVFALSNAFHNPALNKDSCQFQGHATVEGA